MKNYTLLLPLAKENKPRCRQWQAKINLLMPVSSQQRKQASCDSSPFFTLHIHAITWRISWFPERWSGTNCIHRQKRKCFATLRYDTSEVEKRLKIAEACFAFNSNVLNFTLALNFRNSCVYIDKN